MLDPSIARAMITHLASPHIDYRATRSPFAWNKENRSRHWKEYDAVTFNRTGLIYRAIDQVYPPFDLERHRFYVNGAENVLNQYHDEPWWFGEYPIKPTKYNVLQILRHVLKR